MKNYLLRPISICLIAVVFFTACSKEKSFENNNQGGASAQSTGEEIKGTGSIAGIVLPPEADPTIYLFGNTTFKIDVNDDGTIATNSVPAGDYTVQIHPANAAYGDHMINDFRVEAGKTTELGTIVLVKTGK